MLPSALLLGSAASSDCGMSAGAVAVMVAVAAAVVVQLHLGVQSS